MVGRCIFSYVYICGWSKVEVDVVVKPEVEKIADLGVVVRWQQYLSNVNGGGVVKWDE